VVLWIKGKPGAGKSTLMKHILFYCQGNLKDRTIAAHFFNARGNKLEKTLIGMLRSLMYQLLEKDPVLCELFARNYVDKEKKHRKD
jgi:ABC-type ATPase involved in cell division